MLIASIGLSAILMTSALAFAIIKYLGACYLVYLAYQSFRSSGAAFNDEIECHEVRSFWKTFQEGFLIDVLNPKVAIFFMAFLPQFLRDGHGTTSFQLLYLGVLVILVALVIETIYILLASRISDAVRENKSISIWLDRMVGTVFLFLGLKLATSSNT